MRRKIKLTALCVAALVLILGAYASASGTLIKQGMQGEDVKKIQTELKKLGYFNESITGYFGEVTKNAVVKYQKDRNFTPDGVVGSATWSSLVGGSTSGTATTSAKSNTTSSYPGQALKQGMNSQSVASVQARLKQLGYFNENATGYFGQVTVNAVIQFQKKNGLTADGVVGAGTWVKIFGNASSAKTTTSSTPSRGSSDNGSSLVSWDSAKNIFGIGTVATVIDINSGVKFNIKRTFGSNHADCETVTANDTAKMKSIFGNWSWDRRAVIIVVDGRRIAASIAGMPHAGVDNKPGLETVTGRSGGYGRGQNLDVVKGNNMNGHFDVHFLNSRTHNTGKIDSQHQAAVKRAAQYIASH